MKNKALAFILSAAVLFSAFTPFSTMAAEEDASPTPTDTVAATTTSTAKSFPDVASDHIHYDAIMYLAEKSVINGYDDSTFKPENSVTRAEFLKMLIEMAGWGNLHDNTVITGFTDVDAAKEGQEGHWATKYIKVAVDQGLVNGYGDGTFLPENKIKYEEAMKILVCYLGREPEAQERVSIYGIELWPDAYLQVGNSLVLSKNVSCPVGSEATRSMVSQMLYNMKDISRFTNIGATIIQGTTSGGSVISSGGGGGGGGGLGSTMSVWEKIESGFAVSDVNVSGQVVGTVEVSPSGKYNYYYIDENAPKSNFGAGRILVKMDREVNGSRYLLFVGGSSAYLGYRVNIKFDFDGEDKFTITKITSDDTNKITTITSDMIDYDRTATEITNTGKNVLVYRDDRERIQTLSLPDDLTGMKVIYNKVFAGTEYETVPDGEGGETQQPINITMDDFIISNGSITFISSYNGEEDTTLYDLIRVTDSKTYVAKQSVSSGTPRVLTDKYRTGDDAELRLYENGENDSQLEIEKAGTTSSSTTTYTLNSIVKNNVLEISRSLGGKYTHILINSANTGKLTVEDFYSNYIVLGSNYTRYYFSDYYKQFVSSAVELEVDKNVTAYLDSDGKIVWLDITAVSLSKGYLMRSSYDTSISSAEFTVNIIPQNTSAYSTFTVTRNTKINGVTCSTISDPELGSGIEYIYNKLAETAAMINEGKGSMHSTSENVPTSQPVLYATNGAKLTHITLPEVDAENRLTTANRTKLLYTNQGFREGNEIKYTISSDAVFMFVPNARLAWGAEAYKIGTKSQVSSKLKVNNYYYVEPYMVEKSSTSGGTTSERGIYVVYYEDIEREPDFKSDNVVVKDIDEISDDGMMKYKIIAHSGTASSSGYTIHRNPSTPLEETLLAYALDGDYNRISDGNGGYVKRSVEIGDVVRFGFRPNGDICNIELVFDISEGISERKHAIYTNTGRRLGLDYDIDAEATIKYFGRVGLLEEAVADGDVSETDLKMILQDGTEYPNGGTSSKTILSMSKSVYSFNFKSEEEKDENKFGEIAKVSDIDYTTDMVFLFMHYSSGLTPKYIYVVRYDDDIQAKYEQSQNPQIIPLNTDPLGVSQDEQTGMSQSNMEVVGDIDYSDEGDDNKTVEYISAENETLSVETQLSDGEVLKQAS